MTVQTELSEIRQALATVSALHAADNLNRADLIAAINLVERSCDAIAAASAAPDHGISTVPLLTLRQIAAEGRAEAQRVTGRRHHLAVVPADGDAA